MHISNNHKTIAKQSTNVTLPENILLEAKNLHINISQASEHGLVQAIVSKRTKLWLKENKESIYSSNSYIEQKGLPLAKYKMF